MKLFKDMDENQFWLTLWSMVSSLLFLIVLSITFYNTHENTTIGKLVADGKDPVELACLFAPSSYNTAACALIINGRSATK